MRMIAIFMLFLAGIANANIFELSIKAKYQNQDNEKSYLTKIIAKPGNNFIVPYGH